MYALITGASRGIGRAIALALAKDGYDIVINYRHSQEDAEDLAAAIKALGQQAWLLQGDVADRDHMRACLTKTLNHYGPPQVLVLNAGITRDGILAMMPEQNWDQVIDTGLGGFFNVVRPLVGPMCMARKGRIIAIASATGQMGNPGQVNYAAAKGAVIAACKSLAKEIAKRHITVNAVAPGFIETDMTDGLPIDQIQKMIPMQRPGTVNEVAAAVRFLASPDASYITGQVLGINGGLYC